MLAMQLYGCYAVGDICILWYNCFSQLRNLQIGKRWNFFNLMFMMMAAFFDIHCILWYSRAGNVYYDDDCILWYICVCNMQGLERATWVEMEWRMWGILISHLRNASRILLQIQRQIWKSAKLAIIENHRKWFFNIGKYFFLLFLPDFVSAATN